MPRKRVAYLVMESVDESIADFPLTFAPMQALGWTIETVLWRQEDDWDRFDAVYPCAAWDYPQHVDEFETLLTAIEASSAIFLNDAATIRWNMQKTYLRDLEACGAQIVPSSWFQRMDADAVIRVFGEHQAARIVVKPVIGANACDTLVLTDPIDAATSTQLQSLFADRAFVAQPFIDNIQAEGEYSLFFFDGDYIHAVLKSPQDGDFRVQEQFGASIRPVDPGSALRRVAASTIAGIDPVPVYARVDWVRGPDGGFLLMELELIEPSLYLSVDSGAAARFARAFDQRYQELAGK